MKAAITPKQEDEIAELLSNLTPIEYSQLMAKVDRTKWNMIGFNLYSNKRANEKSK